MIIFGENDAVATSIISDEIMRHQAWCAILQMVDHWRNGDQVRRSRQARLSVDRVELYPVLRSPRFRAYSHCHRLDLYKFGLNVSTLPHCTQMSSHNEPTTPPQDPEWLQAHLESQQSTKPNKGSSASGQLLKEIQYVSGSPWLFRKLLTPTAQKESGYAGGKGRHGPAEVLQRKGYGHVSTRPLLSRQPPGQACFP